MREAIAPKAVRAALAVTSGAAALALLVGCSSSPPRPQFQRPSFERASIEQREMVGVPPGTQASAPTQEQAQPAKSARPDAPVSIENQSTRLRFSRGNHKESIEELHVVRREHTMTTVGLKAALGVAASILARGPVVGTSAFSKDDLVGDTIAELQGNPLAIHPAKSDLNEALSKVATRIYRQRAEAAVAEARQDGSSPEEIAEAGQLPAEAEVDLYAGPWALIYENLAGSDEQFRLSMGAALGTAGFMRPPASCQYLSEPRAWSDWKAEDWKLLRSERAKAVDDCTHKLAAKPEKYW